MCVAPVCLILEWPGIEIYSESKSLQQYADFISEYTYLHMYQEPVVVSVAELNRLVYRAMENSRTFSLHSTRMVYLEPVVGVWQSSTHAMENHPTVVLY